MNIDEIRSAVISEFSRASKKFPRFHSAHEGYAIILEEMIELRAEVFLNPVKGLSNEGEITEAITAHRARMQREAIQCAAMCFRFLADL
jgi:hypothetical protein